MINARAHRHRSRRQYSALLATLLAVALPPALSFAAADIWNSPSSANFSTGPWSPGLPGAADSALFTLNSAYTVTFDTSPTNLSFVVANGAVTWITNGSSKIYTVSGNSSITGGSLSLGSSAAALSVNLSGALTINGAASPLLNVAGTNNLTTGNLSLGTDGIAGHSGTITDSSIIALSGASTLTIGAAANSTGNLTISTGSFTTGTGLTSINATGQVNLSGASFNANGDILLNGGTFNQTNGLFNWTASHTLTIQNLAKFNLANSYTPPANAIISVTGIGSQLTDGPGTGTDFAVNNGASLTASAGALVSSSGFFDVGSAGSGSVIIDGAGTSLTANSSGNFIGFGGLGFLTIRNNASAATGGFSIGQGTGASGTLNVQSNANLTTGSISLSTNNTTSTGNINLSNATITQTGTSSLTIGSSVNGTANLTISSSNSIFNTGTGITTINTTGLVNITGGTFNVNGNINVNGGNLTQTNTGVFSLAPGRTMTIQNLGKLTVSGIYSTPANAIINVTGAGAFFNDPDPFANIDISNGAQLNVTAGADVSTGRLFNVGLTGSGTAIFDGAGSTLTAPSTGGQSDTVGNGGNGTLTFRNNAFGNFQTGLVVGAFGGNGTFNVLSNAALNITSLTIGFTGGSIGNANITGGSVNLSSGLFVGISGAGASTLTIGPGGSLVTGGAADTEVDALGLININGGTLSALSNITLFGGTLTQTDASAPNGFFWNPFRTLAVLSGGKANFAGIFTTPAAAVINVSGAGSQFNNTPDNIHFQVALQLENDAQLNVSNGGSVFASNILQIGNTNGNGTASFSGVGTSLNAVGAIYVGGSGVGSLTITNGAAATTGGLTIGNTTFSATSAVNVTNGATLTAGSLFGTLIGPTGTLTITDSTVTLGNLTVNGGSLIFNSGSLTYSGNLTVGFGGILGTNLNLDFSRSLTLSGTTTITPQHQLSLTGGSLSTGALVNNGSFNFASGSLAITGPAGLAIGNGGPLGASLSLASSQTLSVTNATTIAPTGLLFLNGGNVNAAGGLINNGTIQFASPASSLTGNTITNNGTIQGTGFVAAPVNNSGTIEPTGGGGGNLLFTGPFNNSANGTLRVAPGNKLLFQAASFAVNQGLISLAGGTFDNGGSALNNTGQITGFGVLSTGGPGLANNGNITFTGGTSTINGNVTNNPGHTLNIKFQPAVFTGNLVNNANATIKTSFTTATFTGSFQNFGNFLSDPATNIFQGPTLNAGLMSGGPGDVFTLDIFTNTGTFTNGGSLNANNNITNAATFSQSGPQFWSPGTFFTNTAGTATFASNAKLYGLTISAGTVDITNSKFIIETTTASKLTTLTALRHNVATHSLTSSTLPANLALALVDNAITNLPAFGNNPADSNSLLLSPELLGDANIDGHVDLTDLNTILNHFGAATGAWTDGNFDNAATIDLTDLSYVLNNFGLTFASPSAAPDGSPTQNPAAAPEPASIAVLSLSFLVKTRRSKRS